MLAGEAFPEEPPGRLLREALGFRLAVTESKPGCRRHVLMPRAPLSTEETFPRTLPMGTLGHSGVTYPKTSPSKGGRGSLTGSDSPQLRPQDCGGRGGSLSSNAVTPPHTRAQPGS